MSDTKFTPGEWLYGWFAGESVDPEKQQWAIGLGLDDGCATGCRGDDYMLVSGICKEGDARLMSMSKMLLAALEDMVDSYQYEASSENPSLLNARAIIAKARGINVETDNPDSTSHLLP